MRRSFWFGLCRGVAAAALLGSAAGAATWFPLGPFGGDARSFAADPTDSRHLFLGTATGWIYDTHDGGTHWDRLGQISKRNDLVIDHILADHENPKRLIVGAYTVGHLDGGIFISEDYGKTWYSQAEMSGQSVRSLTRSVSNTKELVAGTLRGVFRSVDNGLHWKQISPVDSTEIKEVQSIAIDPTNPDVIYAGTWHLPWKTTDGGVTWSNIKDGIIDDSDVFSIIVDPKDPKIVYASACSGIYKSTSAGEQFHKVQGIPSTARRTRTLEQDPKNLDVVFAGTTEGLYRTEDAGTRWDRLTPADFIVNDVFVDPRNAKHVLIATDRGGIFRSEDGGTSFDPSNAGFSARQVTAYAADPRNAATIYVGVVNDKATGGVFQSADGGVHWEQHSNGLDGRDVFSLLSLNDGTLLAGTGHGIFRMQGDNWVDASALEGAAPPSKAETSSKSNVKLPAPTQLKSPGPERHGPGANKPVGKSGTKAKTSAYQHSYRDQHGFLLRTEFLRHAGGGNSHSPARHASEHQRPATSHSLRGATHLSHAVHGRSPRSVARFQRVQAGRKPSGAAKAPPAKSKTAVSAKTKAQPAVAAPTRLDSVVYALSRTSDVLFAGTSSGLVRSVDAGQHWIAVQSLAMPEVHFVSVLGSQGGTETGAPLVLAASLQRLSLSPDGGATWDTVALPAELTQIGAATLDGEKNLWVGGREGVWLSSDYGATWKSLRNLFLTEVDSLYYDPAEKRVLVTASNSSVAFSVAGGEHKVTYWETGWKLRFIRPVGDHLVGATLFDGVVVQPKMMESPEQTASSPGK